ncbi:MAG: AtpZ/AtpI family protein [Sphingomonas sp.]|nr:AtpZ/AtpI family protein [Sphingomonas sp.]
MFFALPVLAFGRGDAQEKIVVDHDDDEVPILPPDARLKSLDQRLDQIQREEAEKGRKVRAGRVRQFGQRMAAQMIGAPAGGLLFGWGLDTLFKTKPLFMIILMFAGFGIGIRNVYHWTKSTPPSGDRPE